MNKRLLTNREYQALGSWYAGRELLKVKAPVSIVACDYYDTTSSAGDWSGYLLQKLGGKYYLIAWSQSNNWPSGGYTVSTGDLIAEYDNQPTEEDILEAIELYY